MIVVSTFSPRCPPCQAFLSTRPLAVGATATAESFRDLEGGCGAPGLTIPTRPYFSARPEPRTRLQRGKLTVISKAKGYYPLVISYFRLTS